MPEEDLPSLGEGAVKRASSICTPVKETQNTRQFREEDRSPKPQLFGMKKVYLTKEILEELGNPEKVRVTVEVVE